MEGRLNEVSSNVSSRINEVQEQVESLKNIARGTENQNSRRVNEIEKELENMQNRITATIEQLSERANNSSSVASETAPSGYVGNPGASGPVAQPNSTPEHRQHLSLEPPEQNVRYGETETCRNSRMELGETHHVHVARQTPVFGSEISLPHFGNKTGQNPVVYLNALEDYFDLKGTPESQKMMLVKNSLTGSALGWFQIFLSRDVSKFELKSKRDMADYLIELAQLSRLLNPPLGDDEFLNLAI